MQMHFLLYARVLISKLPEDWHSSSYYCLYINLESGCWGINHRSSIFFYHKLKKRGNLWFNWEQLLENLKKVFTFMSRSHSSKLFKDPVTFLALLIPTLLFLSGHFKQQTRDEVFQLSHKIKLTVCIYLSFV